MFNWTIFAFVVGHVAGMFTFIAFFKAIGAKFITQQRLEYLKDKSGTGTD